MEGPSVLGIIVQSNGLTGRARRGLRHGLVIAAAVACVTFAAACGGGGDAAPSTTASPTTTSPYGEAPPVDPPGPDDVVLTVTGPAGSTTYTLAQLKALSGEPVEIDEPFVEQRISFTGVPMSVLLEAAGIGADARISTVALNDYSYDDVASLFTGSDAIVAVQQDGADIPIDKGGPIRIVFPDGSPAAGKKAAWNWSLSEISAT
ncbi:MAG: molybdopterin-dependent oxidoreductase [Acidobacteria bacterium]|nr:molybdopterin-dependent oxidoreductase [Acidobacteriota bacterium]